MWKRSHQLLKAIQQEKWVQERELPEEFWRQVLEWMEGYLLADFLEVLTGRVHEILEIDPQLPEPRILELAAAAMVDFLDAHHASVRIYDPDTGQMLAYGSYPSLERFRATYIPLQGSIAGKVVETTSPFIVPNVEEEPLYHDKEGALSRGVNSLMAVPLEIPRFYPNERDTVGVVQIYFSEKNRQFSPVEIRVAELMARRLSFVFARKKILTLRRLSEKKEAIVRKIFLRLGSREGIKMKDVFNRVIPELADIVNIQSCALFSVTEDRKSVVLEAGYPERAGYHGIGKAFPVESEPAFEMVLNIGSSIMETQYEVVTPSYVLVRDPQRSSLISENLKRLAAVHNINSILYIPLGSEEEINHFMTFDALERRTGYTEDEIEILLFLGREIMKAQQMERLDDILHDFKNPAIATAGFARRLKGLLAKSCPDGGGQDIRRCVEILLEETSRLQELALSVYGVGKEEVVNLTQRVKRRVEINEEAIKEQLKQNIMLQLGPFDEDLHVRCYPLHLERVLDNLLNNATNAIPPKGGSLSVSTFRDEQGMACVRIRNTGVLPEEDRQKLLDGSGKGRGLHITHRIVRLLRGQIEVDVGVDTTTFTVRLPALDSQESKV
ncbi:MAG: GAF domain-containing protein [Thermodesulfobacteriota bacterium]